jgi:hypothetical protein
MTKKDYIAIALVLNKHSGCAEYQSDHATCYDAIINDFCDMLTLNNPRFDRERFTNACYKGIVQARAGTIPRKAF